MEIDLVKVREQIRKLQDVERMASDPDMLALLETVLVNGTSKPKRSADRAPKVVIQSALPGQTAKPKKTKRGDLIAAVRAAALAKHGPFDGYALTREMQAGGYQFGSKTPAITTIDSLRSLVKKGDFKVHRKGRGGKPTLFVKVQKEG